MQKRAHRKIGRFFSLLMTVVLVCSMIPMNAYANDETVSLFNEELDMELNNTEEDETENIIPADDDLTLLEEEVPAEVDEEETLSHAELEDESVIPEEIPLIQQEEVTETTVETMAEAFDAPQPETVMVIFDPDDGTQYEDFYKTTVPVGGKITHKPADPTRDGYLFKGWYGYSDENDEPVKWDFANDTVSENTTLWAAWEEACIVAFDPDDGTQYEDFYKTTVPVGGKVSDKPADPTRDGYLFKGWYGYLDENDKPVMWDFENGTVTENMTLWASWKEDSNGGNNNGGNGEGENNNNGGNGEGGNNNNGGNSGGGTGGSGGSSSGGNSGPVVSGNAGNNTSTNINEQEVPKSSADSERVDIDEQEVPKEKLDYLPKTGEDSTSRIIYGTLILLSLFMFGISLPYRKKTI